MKFLFKFLYICYRLNYIFLGKLSIRLNAGIHPKKSILNYHQWFYARVNSSDRCLDIGCGDGSLLKYLSGNIEHGIGLDNSERSIGAASSGFKSNVTFQCVDACDGEWADIGAISLVIMSNSLEHFERRELLLKGLVSDLNWIGEPRFLIRVPAMDRDWLTIFASSLNLNTFLDRTHFVEYTKNSLIEEFAQVGLKCRFIERRFDEYYAEFGLRE